MLRAFRDRASIYAFEPRPDKAMEVWRAAVLRRSLQNYSSHLRVNAAGMGGSDGMMDFAFCHLGDVSWSLVNSRTAEELRRDDCEVRERVPVVTLDAFARSIGLMAPDSRIQYIKVDVEGGEAVQVAEVRLQRLTASS